MNSADERDARFLTGALVGGLATAAMITVWYLAATVAALDFLPFDLFDWIVRELPGPVVTFAIDTAVSLSGAVGVTAIDVTAKTGEQTLAVLAVIGMGAVAGGILFALLGLSDEPPILIGVILGALLGGLACVLERTLGRIAEHPLAETTWIFGTIVGWGAGCAWVAGQLRATPADRQYQRRQILIRLALAVAAPAGLAAIRMFLTSRDDLGRVGTRWSDNHPLPNADAGVTPVAGTRPELTPLERHYRVDVDTRTPFVDPARWRLKIGGMVEQPLELTLDDLRREEPLHQFVTLSCVSNPIGGDLIGTTRWTGVSLARLIERVKIDPAATHLKITSADGFFETVAIDSSRADSRIMLAYAWDGVPLPAEHGFPLRLYVPDRYGMKQPKWILAVDAIDRWEPGYWVARGWDREGRVKATSVIDAVDAGHTTLAANGPAIAAAGGIAYAGARGISRVEVRVDGGPWLEARLREPLSATTWVIWRAEVPWQAGQHLVEVRCAEADGSPQGEGFHAKRIRA